MLTIDCPFCDLALPVEDGDTVRCDACSVELAFAPDDPARVMAAAA